MKCLNEKFKLEITLKKAFILMCDTFIRIKTYTFVLYYEQHV